MNLLVFSSLLRMLKDATIERTEGKLVIVDVLLLRFLAAAALLLVSSAERHLETAQVVESVFDHLEVSEMQDETQEAAATSSPDPLTLVGPKDRDIDVHHSLPSSVDSCEASAQNQSAASRVPLSSCEIRGNESDMAIWEFLRQNYHQMGFRTSGDEGALVQPERSAYMRFPRCFSVSGRFSVKVSEQVVVLNQISCEYIR